MAYSSSLTEKLAALGIHLPAWPEEPEGDSTSGDWIQRGQTYAEGLRLWRAQLRNVPESTKGVVDQLLRHLHDTGQLRVWDQVVYGAIKPEIQGLPDQNCWRECTKLIRSSSLTPAQLMGIAIDQAERGHFEATRQGFNELSKSDTLDEAAAKDVCLNTLYRATKNLPRGEDADDKEMPHLIGKHISTIKLIHEFIDLQTRGKSIHCNDLAERLFHSTTNPTIIVCGMRHSASTALFNAIRLGFERAGKQLSANYSEYFEISNMKCVTGLAHLTKIHEYREDHYKRANFVITTRRDLRDTVASAKRRGFSLLAKVGGAVQYAAYNRSLHEAWHDKSDLEISYDYFIANPVLAIKDVFELLGLNSSLAAQVAEEVNALPTNNYPVTLLSDTHITDPNRELTFRDTLELKDIASINQRHSDWLQRYSYI